VRAHSTLQAAATRQARPVSETAVAC